MKNLLKKLIFAISCMICTFTFTFAAGSIDGITIEVKDTLNIGEATDFTIAVMKSGEVFKEFSGVVFFSITDENGNYLNESDYIVPNGGIYQFIETDQGKKTFSKGLEIKKAGTFLFLADPFESEVGKATITVLGNNTEEKIEPILITYPSHGSIESKSYVTVMGSCEKLKNSPVVLYLNGRAISSGNTDAKGNFSVMVPELLSGDNEIQAKIVDINNIVLGESPNITIKYQSPQDGIFKNIEILPSREGKQGDKIIFNVSTDEGVSSAQLMMSNGLKYSMDRVGLGLFSKELVATFSGDVDISVSLIENSNEKVYENIDRISIKENIGISNIKFTSTGVDGTQVIVSRDTIGSISKYQINYGTKKDDLSNSVTVTSSTVLIDNLDKDTKYFFQIVPMDSESHNSGDPSDIVEYHPSVMPCIVKGIKVKQEHIGDNYYLVRDPVENVVSYEVYRSDWADMTDARLVGSLTGTRFQYLFNPDATKDEYAYYQVQAICPDGTNIVVDKAQKVKVGPVENILLIIVISIFVYSLYRLHKISSEEY